MIKRYFKRFPHALRGLAHASLNDFGFRTQLYGIGAVVVVALYFLTPLSLTEFLFIILAFLLILITELQNSALEIALDTLHPEHHKGVGVSKDMAAGAVLLAGSFLLIVLATFILTRLPAIIRLLS